MPSKKKKKSKGGGKAVRKVEKQGESLDTQMEQLKIDEDSQTNIDEDALLEEAIKLAVAEKEEMDAAAAEKEEEQLKVCHHGNAVETTELVFFINVFTNTFMSEATRSQCEDGKMIAGLSAASDAVKEKYPYVYYDPCKVKLVVSYYLCNGTQHVLQGDFVRARLFAAMAGYFETVEAFLRSENKVNTDTNTKTILEVCNCERTLVKYLRKRIPCSCLDEIYKEVKSMTRTGICFNCSAAVERSKMLTCARCGGANYCCRACQKADWHRHKGTCDQSVTLNAKQVSRGQL